MAHEEGAFNKDLTLVCKYNQQGFCKYRQLCKKQHNNQICPSHPSCQNLACQMRHPRQCRSFNKLGKCKFSNCAYLHVPDENSNKLDKLEKEVVELRETVIKLSKSCDQLKLELSQCKCDKNKKMNEDIEQLKESVKQLAKACQQKTVNNKLEVSKKTKTKDARKAKGFHCNKCDYECINEMTLKKHTNTKHMKDHYRCEKCMKVCESKNMLHLHVKETHKETVLVNSTAFSNELASKIEEETSDNDISEIIPQLDGPAEEIEEVTPAKEVTEEDSMKEEEKDLEHLPTAEDPDDVFQNWMSNLSQEKIENMSEKELIHMNAQLARKSALKMQQQR